MQHDGDRHGAGAGFSAPGDGSSVLGEVSLPLRFVGSGSEYFRIWVVNLLLTLLTLGLYYPYAKLRRLRYFFGATEVGGHPLSFHARGRNMYLGYALVAALGGVYSLAGQMSPMAGLVAFVLVAAIWPALWHSALRFRLFNTAWRGMRFGFAGTRGAAYLALWPLFVLAGLLAAVGLLLPEPTPDAPPQAGLAAVLLALLPVALLLLLPVVLWLLRRYQHDNYQLASERTRFAVPLTAYYGLALRTAGLALVVGLLALVVVALGFFSGLDLQADDTPARRVELVLRGIVAAGVGLLLLQVLVRPYFTARQQNLVWNGTRSHNLRFDSALRLRPLMWLTLKNWLLMVVTLGLYYPFAAVAVARLRLQAVRVVSTLDPDAFVAHARPVAESAAGDAAGDLFGLDIGL